MTDVDPLMTTVFQMLCHYSDLRSRSLSDMKAITAQLNDTVVEQLVSSHTQQLYQRRL